MKYSSDYETLESLQKLQTTVTVLTSDAEKQLISAKKIFSEMNSLKNEIESQQSRSQELADCLLKYQQIQEGTQKQIQDEIENVNEEIEKSTLHLNEIKRERLSLKEDFERFQNLKKELVLLFQEMQDMQSQVHSNQQTCSEYFKKSSSVLEEALGIAQSIEINTEKINTQYEQFLKNSTLTQTLKIDLASLSDQHTNLVLRERRYSLGLGGGVMLAILLAIFL